MDLENRYNKQIENIRDTEFPYLKGTTYVDHVGTTLYAKSQVEAYQKDLLSNLYGNPHSHSQSSRLSTDVIDQIRFRILKHFNTNPDNYSVIFTSGCTGALKLIAETFTFDPDKEACYQDNHLNNQSQNSNCHRDDSILQDRRKGCFAYLLDNHTSVQGMRQIVSDKTGVVLCLDEHELDSKSANSEPVLKHENYAQGGNCLFVYPAQSNFSGRKYPLHWIKLMRNNEFRFQGHHQGHWYVALDAAAYVCTTPLDLASYTPDFVTLSFYKMFGIPTGLGVLLVRNDSAQVLHKNYFGGGTVAASSAREMFHVLKPALSDGFEDGTVSFLDIIALRHGFDALDRVGGGMRIISLHTFSIAQYFHHFLSSLHHGNGHQLAEIYCDDDFDNIETQGAIVNFNLKRMDGSYIGFAEVDKMAQLYNVHLRTGCFCNIGACQKYLGLTSQQIRSNFEAGHVCGDDRDLIDGKPTGSIRISFGYMSTISDAQKCLQFIVECFLEGVENKQGLISKVNKCYTKCKSEVNSSPIDLVNNSKDANNLFEFKNSQSSSARDSNSETDSNSEIQNLTFSTASATNSDRLIHDESFLNTPMNSNLTFSQSYIQSDSFLQMDRLDVSANQFEVDHILQSCSDDVRRLTNIYLYPVKSCGAFQVSEWCIGPRGLIYDREWMIVSESGVTLSQKREPKLCLLHPSIDLDKQTLVLTFPDMERFELPLDSSHRCESADIRLSCTSKVCGDRINGIDCGEEVSDWLSEALQRPGCRLVQQTKEDGRHSKLKDSVQQASSTDQANLSLANESQFLLISRSSVVALQNKMVDKQEDEPCADLENLIGRFRGNFIIGGGEAFDEDSWNYIELGENRFMSQGGCSRCQMICLDQTTGERNKEPLSTLAAWRGRKIPFGIHLRIDSSPHSNKIKIGDIVRIL